MGLRTMIARARASATGALSRHRPKIDQGIDKIGEMADARTGGRHRTRIRRITGQARSGLDRIDPDRPDPGRPDRDRPDPDGPDPAAPSRRP